MGKRAFCMFLSYDKCTSRPPRSSCADFFGMVFEYHQAEKRLHIRSSAATIRCYGQLLTDVGSTRPMTTTSEASAEPAPSRIMSG